MEEPIAKPAQRKRVVLDSDDDEEDELIKKTVNEIQSEESKKDDKAGRIPVATDSNSAASTTSTNVQPKESGSKVSGPGKVKSEPVSPKKPVKSSENGTKKVVKPAANNSSGAVDAKMNGVNAKVVKKEITSPKKGEKEEVKSEPQKALENKGKVGQEVKEVKKEVKKVVKDVKKDVKNDAKDVKKESDVKRDVKEVDRKHVEKKTKDDKAADAFFDDKPIKTVKDSPVKKAPSKATIEALPKTTSNEDDDFFDDEPITKKGQPIKKEVAKRKREDDDDFFDDKPIVKDKGKQKKPKKKVDDVDDDDDDDDFFNDDPVVKSQPKRKTTSSTSKVKQPAKKAKAETGSPMKVKKAKKPEDELPEYRWWEEDVNRTDGKRWNQLVHNGVLFAPEYKPHGVKMLYDGKPVDLTPDQEELATYYAQYLESDHVQKPQFNKNFFNEFLKVLNPKGAKKHFITDLKKCDFRPIHQHIIAVREERKNRSKEEKEAEKKEKEEITKKYGFATVDGQIEKIANFRVEPPGLFLGRGDHPKAGQLKKRIQPEDVTLNIGKNAPIPECPVPGHNWGKIVHDQTVVWLAYWRDNINGAYKYVWLSAASRFRGESDLKKFETARKLKNHIQKIRKNYYSDMKSDSLLDRQRAVALYLIDKLALRVGNEKDEEEADTVGCCSLRVEHVTLKDDCNVELDFLGKDSMRYFNTVKVDKCVYDNLKKFMKKKEPGDDLFDELTTSNLNQHLKKQMEGLTAKVFRTYNASITLEQELAKMPDDLTTTDEKLLFYNRANREVAVLCNHQRSLPKKHGEQMQKLDEKIDLLKERKAMFANQIKAIKAGKPVAIYKVTKKNKDGEEEVVDKPMPDTVEKCNTQIERLNAQIHKHEISKTAKDELKTIALGTSKINYLDPRITTSWCLKNDVGIERIFSKTLRQKFPWAMSDSYRDFVF